MKRAIDEEELLQQSTLALGQKVHLLERGVTRVEQEVVVAVAAVAIASTSRDEANCKLKASLQR